MRIRTPSEKDIYSFFLSLNDRVLYNFNPYPDANTKDGVKKISKNLPKDKNQKNFGVFEGDKMAGFGFLKVSPKKTTRELCQFGIALNELYQGMGYGKALGKWMVDWARKNDFKKIWLTVFSDNIKAIRLYKSLGFQIEGVFMRNEKFGKKYRHVISMALFFDYDPYIDRKALRNNLSQIIDLN